jgi:hypothetical protein
MRGVHERFTGWRSRIPGGGRYRTLWTAAAEVGRVHGVFRTAKVLRLEYGKLKRLAAASSPVGRKVARLAAPPAAFVELLGSGAGRAAECLIELEGPRARCLSVEGRHGGRLGRIQPGMVGVGVIQVPTPTCAATAILTPLSTRDTGQSARPCRGTGGPKSPGEWCGRRQRAFYSTERLLSRRRVGRENATNRRWLLNGQRLHGSRRTCVVATRDGPRCNREAVCLAQADPTIRPLRPRPRNARDYSSAPAGSGGSSLVARERAVSAGTPSARKNNSAASALASRQVR